jgi:serine/threonine-protein kinase
MIGTIPGLPARSSDGTDAPADEETTAQRILTEPRVGSKIGPYRLVKLLGQGTTGRVFEVEHEKIGRRAAMKTLSAEHAGRPGAVKRLFTEALAVNRINNVHIVEVTDIVEMGEHHLVNDGKQSLSSLRVNALVMELLEGRSLGQVMMSDGPLPPERFLPIMAQVSEALAAAHGAGFIHRDLKPDNIFLIQRDGENDFVKLLDFGLAKTVNIEPGLLKTPALRTLDGTFLGTPAYVSPEQASGKQVDHRTDIYSFGVILYELVCGRLPFDGASVGDFLIKHLTVAPPPLPDDILSTKLGRTLDAIIQRCLAKDPADRFPSAGQLTEILDAVVRGEPVQFTAMDTYLKPWRLHRRSLKRTLARLGVGVGIGLALSVAVGLLFSDVWRDAPSAPGPSAGAPTPAGEQPAVAGGQAPAPSSASAPAPARQVTLSFESDPPGAEARIVGEEETLGTTPFETSVTPREEPLQLELRMEGYEPVRISTPTDVSRTVSVMLKKEAPAAAGRRQRPATRGVIGKDETINPFR